MSIENWHKYYLGMAEYISKKSKDPSTKTGAIIVRPDWTIASIGFNGFPRGIQDDERLFNREQKYELIIHAEMNAILNAAEKLTGYTLIQFPGRSCARCAVHCIQAGIKNVVNPQPSNEFYKRWKESMDLSFNLFKEANVNLIEYPTINLIED